MRISDWSADVCSSDLLTVIDRRLIRGMDDMRLVSASDRDPFQQSLRVGRFQKLGRLGLASHIGGDSWRLGPDLAHALRRMGERGDILSAMPRELTARDRKSGV